MSPLEMITEVVFLLAALAVLATSAKYVVEKAIRLAKFFKISELAVGFIFIAVLTSLPELSVAVVSSVAGNNNLSLGDVLGSNVTNIALILGFCGFLGFRKRFQKKEINNTLVLLAISLLPLLLIFDGQLTYFDGAILLFLFAAFIYYVLSKKVVVNKIEKVSKLEAAKDFLIFVASIGVVIISSGFAVASAVNIATTLGLFQSFIGATIIALSTSLPEFAVDVTAVRKGRGELALGDIVGSCVTNLTLILGINTILNPFPPNMKMVSSLIVFVFVTAVALGYILWKKRTISKKDGLILMGLYVLYLLSISGVQIIQKLI